MKNLLCRWVCSLPIHVLTLKTASVLSCAEQLGTIIHYLYYNTTIDKWKEKRKRKKGISTDLLLEITLFIFRLYFSL